MVDIFLKVGKNLSEFDKRDFVVNYLAVGVSIGNHVSWKILEFFDLFVQQLQGLKIVEIHAHDYLVLNFALEFCQIGLIFWENPLFIKNNKRQVPQMLQNLQKIREIIRGLILEIIGNLLFVSVNEDLVLNEKRLLIFDHFGELVKLFCHLRIFLEKTILYLV